MEMKANMGSQAPAAPNVDPRGVVNSALDAIVVADKHNTIRDFNPAAEAVFGWSRDQVLGKDLSLIIPEEMRERHKQGLADHVRTGHNKVLDRRLELEALRADGSRFPIEISVSRMGSPDDPLFTAFIRDLSTSRLQAARLLEQSRRLRVLAECQRELAGLSTTSERLYDQIAKIAQKAMGADGAAFEVPEGDALVYRAISGMAAIAPTLRVPRLNSLSGLAFDSGTTLACADASSDPRVDAASCAAVGLGSMVVGVLTRSSEKVGVIKAMARQKGQFTDEDVMAMDVLVRSLGETLERIHREREVAGALELHGRILSIQQELANSTAPVQEVMALLSQHAMDLTGADGAVVELVDGEDMVYAAAQGSLLGQEGLRLKRRGSISGLCAELGRLLESPDTTQDHRVDAAACAKLGVASLVVAPLFGAQGVVGVLKVVNSRPHAFTSTQAEAVNSLVQSMGVLIQRRAAADSIAASERKFRLLFSQNPHPMWVYEFETLRILEVNEAAVKLYGYARSEFLAMSILDLRPVEDHDALRNFVKRLESLRGPSAHFQARHKHKDGQLVDVEISGDDINFDGRRARLVLAHDVTAKRRAEHERALAEAERQRVMEDLERAVTHDALTALPRFQTAAPWIADKLAGGKALGVLLLGLDRFSALNQTVAHDVADSVMATVGLRLGRLHDDTTFVCHLSGDEFVMLVVLESASAARQLAERARSLVSEPIDLEGFRINLTATVGIAVSPEHGETANELLRRAQAAAERGKEAGRDCIAWFSASDMAALDDRIVLGGQLRSAIKRKELFLAFQPLFQGAQAQPVGFEALLRWKSESLGQVPPSRFIPVAESLGLMPELGSWVVGEACRQARAWIDAGAKDFTLAVNVSSLQLQRPGLVATVAEAIQAARLPEGCLELEITESALIENLERVKDKLRRFAQMGIRVALDDFGTGYSSLAYLKHLSIQKLKIDKSFVTGLPNDERDAAMARTIVSIAHQFGMQVAAEGIETLDQAQFLESIGCDLLQGYLLGRPMPANDAFMLLRPDL